MSEEVRTRDPKDQGNNVLVVVLGDPVSSSLSGVGRIRSGCGPGGGVGRDGCRDPLSLRLTYTTLDGGGGPSRVSRVRWRAPRLGVVSALSLSSYLRGLRSLFYTSKGLWLPGECPTGGKVRVSSLGTRPV